MRALSTSTGLGFAHFGALAGVGKGQGVSTARSAPLEIELGLIRTQMTQKPMQQAEIVINKVAKFTNPPSPPSPQV
jgi:hypothetical protein